MIRNNAVHRYDDEQEMAYAVLEDQWVGYANAQSMKEKVMLVFSSHCWSINLVNLFTFLFIKVTSLMSSESVKIIGTFKSISSFCIQTFNYAVLTEVGTSVPGF